MSLTTRSLAALCCAAGMLAAPAWAAAPHDPQAALRQIDRLSDGPPRAVLHRIEALKNTLGPDTPYEEHQRLLRTESWLREDIGDNAGARAVEREALRLARCHGDTATAAWARLGEVRELLDRNRLDEAHALLEGIAAQVPPQAPPAVRAAVAAMRGDVHNGRARFEQALEAYLAGVRLLQGDPADAQQWAMLHARIAQVHINADNPAGALKATAHALAAPALPMQARGRLEFTRGIALVRLGRGPEGVAAFEKALQASASAGLPALEAAVRGNLADYHLRQHDYGRAGDEARRALAASAKVDDQNMVLMARANLGFALMGQGRLAEGLPHVDAVIDALRAAKVSADVEAMLDEKGRMLERAGHYRDALATVREQQSLQQQGARIARDRAIAALQEQFDADRRSQQIALLQRENGLKDAQLRSRRTAQLATTFAAALTVLAGAIVYVLYRRTARGNARLRELNDQLEFRSTHDPLTGLHNRGALTEKMAGRRAGAASERRQAAAGVDCFVLMDIDHFKSINDRWGHAAGDAVLVEVARRLVGAVRDTDMVVRWGGEEFVIHAPGTDPASIPAMARRFLDAVGAVPVDAGHCAIPVTVTAGACALAAREGLDWQAAVRVADWALYQGKAQGRNQARIVTGLGAPAAEVLAGLDGDGAALDRLLAVDCVRGPAQPGH
jgi:diguanylate cyclase (GGDEF)-like protein